MRIPLQERYLSALSLKLFTQCPLRFKRRYIDGLYLAAPTAGEVAEQRALQQGEYFHLMARRYYAGLQPGALGDEAAQAELDVWLDRLKRFVPLDCEHAFYPELELRLTQPDLRLMAKFDLLVVAPDGQATIYDWKTLRRTPSREQLAKAYQTVIYRYMLCAAGGAYSPGGAFRPDQVRMVYWNPMQRERVEEFVYSEAQYRADDAALRRLAARILATPLDGFAAAGDEWTCARCEYRPLCHGQLAEGWEEEEDDLTRDLSTQSDVLYFGN